VTLEPGDGEPRAAGPGAIASGGSSGLGELVLTFVVFVIVAGLLIVLLAAATRSLGSKAP
jgi:hypothetical protein